MVGLVISFASTTAFLAVETLSENGNGRTMLLCRDVFAKFGQTNPSDPNTLGMRRLHLQKETRERKSYGIDQPLFLILFEVGQIENEMHKNIGEGFHYYYYYLV